MTVYLERDGRLIEMAKQGYDAEDVLPELIATHPDLIADKKDSGLYSSLLFIDREVPIADSDQASGRWSLDHLFCDREGIPTLVEVKRSSDTRIRREVVGQLIEYAANGPRYWPRGTVRSHFEARCRRDGKDPDEAIKQEFGEDLAVDEWWNDMDGNMREGKLRLLFVADEISPELKAMIEFLNEQMVDTTVLGVEVPQFTYEAAGHRMYVSTVIGVSERAESVKTRRKSRRWTRDEWLALHEERAEPDDVEVTHRPLGWADSNSITVAFGTAMNNPTMKFERQIGDRSLGVVRLWPGGDIEINFGHLAPPLDDMAGWRRLAEHLERIDGVQIPADRLGKFQLFRAKCSAPRHNSSDSSRRLSGHSAKCSRRPQASRSTLTATLRCQRNRELAEEPGWTATVTIPGAPDSYRGTNPSCMRSSKERLDVLECLSHPTRNA